MSKFSLPLMKQHHFNICWQYFNIETSGKFFGGGFVATEIKVKYPSDFFGSKERSFTFSESLVMLQTL